MEPDLRTFVLLALLFGASAATVGDWEILQHIFRNYTKSTRPDEALLAATGKRSPTDVTVNLLLRRLYGFDPVQGVRILVWPTEYSVQITFRQQWRDVRVAYEKAFPKSENISSFVALEGDFADRIWLPDTFFPNAKEARRETIDQPNTLIRLYSNDKHIGDILNYTWKGENPVQIHEQLRYLPNRKVVDVTTSYCHSQTSTGVYPCLRLVIGIVRRYGAAFCYRLFIPSSLFVIVSWFSFWLDARSALGARSVVLSVSLLAVIILTAAYSEPGVNVEPLRPIDTWTLTVIAFTFGALLEFLLVYVLANGGSAGNEKPNDLAPTGLESAKQQRFNPMNRDIRVRCATIVDWFSRVCFPIAFLIFNIVFWTVYY